MRALACIGVVLAVSCTVMPMVCHSQQDDEARREAERRAGEKSPRLQGEDFRLFFIEGEPRQDGPNWKLEQEAEARRRAQQEETRLRDAESLRRALERQKAEQSEERAK